MKFLEIMQKVKVGDKIRPRHWSESVFIYINDNNLLRHGFGNPENIHLSTEDLASDEWEFHKNPKTLIQVLKTKAKKFKRKNWNHIIYLRDNKLISAFNLTPDDLCANDWEEVL